MPLRPSTVRGMLRWWFRAGAAALLWPRDSSWHEPSRAIEALRQAGSAVFGSTERASTVVVLPPKAAVPWDSS
jgi:CRISPR type III-B/RAMP module RAMP protein Cmr1